MTEVTIKEWTNYGHRRGYASAADGAKLGWIDLKTGIVTVEAGADVAAVTAALEAWRAAQTPMQGASAAIASAVPALATMGPAMGPGMELPVEPAADAAVAPESLFGLEPT